MNDWQTGNPNLQYYLDRGRQERADALVRGSHLVIRAVAGVFGAILRLPVSGLRRIAAGLRLWHSRRRATRALLSLDDRLLRDIGLTRGEIWAAVHGALQDRETVAPRPAAPAVDIALSDDAVGGCNDNQRRPRAA
jgi:uncharacterized protein YjiS (DUF1127 family)